MTAIALPESDRLAVQLEGARDLARCQHRERQSLLVLQPPGSGCAREVRLLAADCLQQRTPVVQPADLDSRCQAQAVHAESRGVGIARDLPGIVPGPEKTGVLAGPGERALDEERRQVDAAGNAVVSRA